MCPLPDIPGRGAPVFVAAPGLKGGVFIIPYGLVGGGPLGLILADGPDPGIVWLMECRLDGPDGDWLPLYIIGEVGPTDGLLGWIPFGGGP